MIAEHNKAMQEEYTKLTKSKKTEKKPDDHQVSDESTRPNLSTRVDATISSSLPGVGRRFSHQEEQEQWMLQSYKIALERERLNHLDLANIMIAERERSMSTNNDRMHGFNMHNSAHTMSAPRPLTSFANDYNWDMRSPRIMDRPLSSNGMRCLPFNRGAAAKNNHGPHADEPMEDSRKPAAKSDAAEMQLDVNESTSVPSSAFIRQLHEIVSDPDTNDIIHWLPCGKIFNISDKKAFTKQLIPRFQDEIAGTSNNEKFKSFKLYLKQAGFERVTLDSYNGAFKKDGFVKLQTAVGPGASLNNNASVRQFIETFANVNRQAQLMAHYQDHRSMYPHRSSLPGMSQNEIRMSQHMTHDMMLEYYQGLAAARASLPPYGMMNNRRLSMPTSSDADHSYSNRHVSNTLNDGEKKQNETKE